MVEKTFSNLFLDPIIPSTIIFLFVLIFISLILFALINKANGSFVRLTILSLMIIIILQPSIRIEKRTLDKDIITIVIDKTLSQKITGRDKYLEKYYNKMLQKLKEFSNFKIFEIEINDNYAKSRFGSAFELINNKTVEKKVKRENLDSSNIITVLKEEINRFPIKKLSTIFILTDGQIQNFNGKIYDKFNVPIYFLLIGKKFLNDKNVSIISHPDFGYLNENVKIKILAKDLLMKDGDIDIKINNKSNTILKKSISNKKEFIFDYKIDNIGNNFLRISSESRNDEVTNLNNTKIINIKGIRKKLKVLLISGDPYLGTRIWRNFLKSDPSVELVHMTVLRPPEKNDNTPFSELSLIPFPTKELFEKKLKNFQLVIFDNFKGKNVISPVYFQNLINFLENGGGILEIAGDAYSSNTSLFRTEIGRILPGIPSGSSLKKTFKPKLTELGEKHPVTKSLFSNYQDYSPWYEMTNLLSVDKESSTLMSGIDEKPLLVTKKFGNGRLAQIYSTNLWLWSKNTENHIGGPYNKLIKNLAHWLMKEPSLEENIISFKNIEDDKIRVFKKFILKPKLSELDLFITDPIGQKKKIKLLKENNYKYFIDYKYKISGEYIVTDGTVEKSFKVKNFNYKEIQELNITDRIINEKNLSNIFTKVHFIENNEVLEFKKSSNVIKDNVDEDYLHLLNNENFVFEGFKDRKLLNPNLIIFFTIIIMFLCWRRESK